MKKKFGLISILGLSFTIQTVSATTLKTIEVKTPYVTASCKNLGVDSISTLALQLNKLTATESKESINLDATASLLLCKLSSDSSNNKSLNWVKVNPFKGYEVQYFDFKTNSIQTRKEFIDSKKSFNRLEVVAFNDDTGSFSSSNTSPNTDDSFSGKVSVLKKDLFNQNDLDSLNKGEFVQKKIALYFNSNFTTIVNGEEVLLGDQNRSGQNIILTFKKVDNTISLFNVK
jgi:hypothetical protein